MNWEEIGLPALKEVRGRLAHQE